MTNENVTTDPQYTAACHVIWNLQQDGHDACFVGGCVRDLLLGRVPHDWDVATSALPETVEEIFASLAGFHTVPTGKSFGVITVILDGIPTQVATFRKDGVYIDGRRPDTVELITKWPAEAGLHYCGLRLDVQRRDFTINGMAFNPIDGQLIDLVSGQRDLEDRVVRAIGNAYDRFEEDLLRMLRAVRFTTVLDFTLEGRTADAIRSLAYRIREVAWERISEELRRILLSPNRARGIQLLDDRWLLSEILPEVFNLKGVAQPPEFHPEGDCWVHTLLCLSNLPDDATFTQAMATLLHDIGKPPTFEETDRIRFPAHAAVGEEMAREVCQRLRLTNDETEEICWLVGNHMKIYVVEEMRKSGLRRFLSETHFPSLMVVGRADALSSHGNNPSLGHLDFVAGELEKYQAEPLRPVPFLRGQDLINLEVPPGPIYKQTLQHVEDAQLEGTVTTYEEALALAVQYLKENQ